MMLTCLPLMVVPLATDLTVTWPALVLFGPLAGPAVLAAFACFREHSGGGVKVISVYFKAWWRHLRRGLRVGLILAVAVVVIVVDALAFAGQVQAAAVVPFFGIVGLVGLATWFVELAAIEEFGRLRLRDSAKASLYCAIRGGGWSLVSLVGAAIWGLVLIGKPVLAWSIATAPVLFLIWANSRHALQPLRRHLEDGSTSPTTAQPVTVRQVVSSSPSRATLGAS
jgi:uncharacterized membrane protein YesL